MGSQLRRLKEEVEKGIAPKEETLVEVELTAIQKKYYQAIFERNVDFLRKGGKGMFCPPPLPQWMPPFVFCD